MSGAKNSSADVSYKWAEKGNFVWLLTEDGRSLARLLGSTEGFAGEKSGFAVVLAFEDAGF
jgi:hypothetical protein